MRPATHAEAGGFSTWRVARACRAFRCSVQAAPGTHSPLELLQTAMQFTPQGSGSVLEHCVQTERCARLLWQALWLPAQERGRWLQEQDVSWMAAELFEEPVLFRLRCVLLQQLLRYVRWHDCGKPFVWTLDAQGRSHYPEHAEISARIWA